MSCGPQEPTHHQLLVDWADAEGTSSLADSIFAGADICDGVVQELLQASKRKDMTVMGVS